MSNSQDLGIWPSTALLQFSRQHLSVLGQGRAARGEDGRCIYLRVIEMSVGNSSWRTLMQPPA